MTTPQALLSRTAIKDRLSFWAIILTILVVVVYADAWRSFDSRTADFAAFYSGTILWENAQRAYDLDAACDVQKQVDVSLCMPFFHPPVLLPMLSVVVNHNYVWSYWRWSILIFLIVILCAIPIYKLTDRDLIKTGVLICFFPVFVSLMQGQDTAFVLFGVLVCVLLLRDGKDSLAGVALGLTVLRPHLALALGIPLLFSRPKAFRTFCVTGLILVGFSFLLVGSQGFLDLLSTIVSTAHGLDESNRQAKMFNLVGIFARAGLNPLFAWPFFVAAIVGISLLWRKAGVTLSTFGLAIIIALFTSPHLHTHDLALLILPLLTLPAITVPLLSLGLILALPFNFGPFVIYATTLALTITLARRQSEVVLVV